MIEWLFHFNDLIVGSIITVLFLTMALCLITLVRWFPRPEKLTALHCSSPDLTMLLSIVFGLMIGFLASEVEGRNEKATNAVNAEANALQNIASMLIARTPEVENVRRATTTYIRSVLLTELSGRQSGTASLAASKSMVVLFQSAIALAAANASADAVSSRVLDLVVKASEARASRLAIAEASVNELKWWLVCFLLFALQVSIVLVHVTTPRTMAIVLLVVSFAGSVTVAAVAMQEDPFSPPRMVSVVPLKMALKAFGATEQ